MSFQQRCQNCSQFVINDHSQLDHSCSNFSEIQDQQSLCLTTTINNRQDSLNYLNTTNEISYDMLPYIQKSIQVYYNDDSDNSEGLDWDLFKLEELEYFLNGLKTLYKAELEELKRDYEDEKSKIIEELKRRDKYQN